MAQYHTKGTRLKWSSFEEWHESLKSLEARRFSRKKKEAITAHLRALPIALVKRCTDKIVLTTALADLKSPSGPARRPIRGARARAPQTRLIVAISNQITRLDAADSGNPSDPARPSGKTNRARS